MPRGNFCFLFTWRKVTLARRVTRYCTTGNPPLEVAQGQRKTHVNSYRRQTVHRGKVDPGVSELPRGIELSRDHVNRPSGKTFWLKTTSHDSHCHGYALFPSGSWNGLAPSLDLNHNAYSFFHPFTWGVKAWHAAHRNILPLPELSEWTLKINGTLHFVHISEASCSVNLWFSSAFRSRGGTWL